MLRAGLPLDELLAPAAASHSAVERHLAGTRRILELAGVTEDDLRNVPDLPYDPVVRDAWIREGRLPSRLAQNCSGKHAADGQRTARSTAGPSTTTLTRVTPSSRPSRRSSEDLTGQAIAQVTVDGCGAPPSAPLHGLARAAARITTAPAGTPEARVADAMREHAEMASGSGRDVAVMRAVPGLLTKDGFEGVQMAALPDGRAVAVKIADGADRARGPAAAAALARAGVAPALLAEFGAVPLLGGGAVVGGLRPARALDPLPG